MARTDPARAPLSSSMRESALPTARRHRSKSNAINGSSICSTGRSGRGRVPRARARRVRRRSDRLAAARWVDDGSGVTFARASATGDAAGAPGLACLPSPGLAPLRIQMTEPARPASLDGSGFRIDLPAGSPFFPGPLAARAIPTNDLAPGLTKRRERRRHPARGGGAQRRRDARLRPAEGRRSRSRDFRFDAVTSRWSFEGDAIDSAASRIACRSAATAGSRCCATTRPRVVTDVRPGPGSPPLKRRPEMSAAVEESRQGNRFRRRELRAGRSPPGVRIRPDRGTAKPFVVPVLKPGAPPQGRGAGPRRKPSRNRFWSISRSAERGLQPAAAPGITAS